MRILIASDHAGYILKEEIKTDFFGNSTSAGFENSLIFLLNKLEIIDLGCNSQESVDYPDYAHRLAKELTGKDDVGILICGSGVGMSIVANRYPHIRAALCFNSDMAVLARKHNNANILVLGARNISKEEAFESIKKFLSTDFEQGKHLIRVNKI